MSLIGVAVLIGGQLLTQSPKTYRIEEYEAPADANDVEVFEFDAPFAPPLDATAAP